MINSRKSTMPKSFGINHVIWLLTFSDIFTWGFYMATTALVGIYISNKLGVNATEIVGIGTFVYYASKGVIQLPIGIITDNIKKDRDDILFLLCGNLLMAVPFLLYPIINTPFAYYALQFIFGMGAAMNLVNWRKLFAKNLDENKEGFEYGIYDLVFSIFVSVFGAAAGIIANQGQNYFDLIMIGIGLLTLTSGIWVTLIYFVNHRKSA